MADKKAGSGYHISNDKGKADSNMTGKGPGPVRGSSFGKVGSGPKQGDQKSQPKVPWHKGKMDKRGEGDGDAN